MTKFLPWIIWANLSAIFLVKRNKDTNDEEFRKPLVSIRREPSAGSPCWVSTQAPASTWRQIPAWDIFGQICFSHLLRAKKFVKLPLLFIFYSVWPVSVFSRTKERHIGRRVPEVFCPNLLSYKTQSGGGSLVLWRLHGGCFSRK